LNASLSEVWVWPAIALAFSLGVLITHWVLKRKQSGSSDQVNQEYFKGLNFLLNEQPDKAIEVFIKALEVDSETVELHLALGGLFRRKGQVDRATRIHQNLIARPSLTDPQRIQAIYELAQDYYKAGLLDRAENLFIELKDSVQYRARAIEGLCSIYQKEKDWVKAIEVTRLHKRADRGQYARRTAHYWCELAEIAIVESEFDAARKYLRSAQSADRSAARAILLRGELNFKQENFRQAMTFWQGLTSSHPALAELIVEKMVRCYQRLNDTQGLKEYLLNLVSIPKNEQAFKYWRQSLIEIMGEERAMEQILTQVQSQGFNGAVISYLYDTTDDTQLSYAQQKVLLKDMLSRAKSSNIEYTCVGCGFDTKAMHWLCPNCGEWDSFS